MNKRIRKKHIKQRLQKQALYDTKNLFYQCHRSFKEYIVLQKHDVRKYRLIIDKMSIDSLISILGTMYFIFRMLYDDRIRGVPPYYITATDLYRTLRRIRSSEYEKIGKDHKYARKFYRILRSDVKKYYEMENSK